MPWIPKSVQRGVSLLLDWLVGVSLTAFCGLLAFMRAFAPDPLFGFDLPDLNKLVAAAIGSLAISVSLLLRRVLTLPDAVADRIKVPQCASICRGVEESKRLVDGLLTEVRTRLRRGEHVDVFEANLEANPPPGEQVLASHRSLVDEATARRYFLRWRMIVGDNDGRKNSWVGRLRTELERQSERRYQLKLAPSALPLVNFVVVRELHKVYMGLGSSDIVNEEHTGGVLIESEHIANALSAIFEKLFDPDVENTP